ncbi:hypothetical protein [Nocardia noduli]|uniref:hypothetical protein n=1 Tax=Nocardia noduli TaxID=2815722 RepID=UPI001C232E10|nr:hypothetical protein [Nocardia noduli]
MTAANGGRGISSGSWSLTRTDAGTDSPGIEFDDEPAALPMARFSLLRAHEVGGAQVEIAAKTVSR